MARGKRSVFFVFSFLSPLSKAAVDAVALREIKNLPRLFSPLSHFPLFFLLFSTLDPYFRGSPPDKEIESIFFYLFFFFLLVFPSRLVVFCFPFPFLSVRLRSGKSLIERGLPDHGPPVVSE